MGRKATHRQMSCVRFIQANTGRLFSGSTAKDASDWITRWLESARANAETAHAIGEQDHDGLYFPDFHE